MNLTVTSAIQPAGKQDARWSFEEYFLMSMMFVPAAIFTWGIHEYAHWQIGVLRGYDMWITFNQAGPTQGHFESRLDQILVAAAGPIVTIVQALVSVALIVRFRQLWLYAFLFLTLWTRVLAFAVSYLTHPNDEAVISNLLSLPMWLIPSVSVCILFCATYYGSRLLSAGWKVNAIAYLMSSIMTAAIVFSDQYLFF